MTYVMGGAVQKAGEALLEKIKKACSILYGWKIEEIQTENGLAWVPAES